MQSCSCPADLICHNECFSVIEILSMTSSGSLTVVQSCIRQLCFDYSASVTQYTTELTILLVNFNKVMCSDIVQLQVRLLVCTLHSTCRKIVAASRCSPKTAYLVRCLDRSKHKKSLSVFQSSEWNEANPSNAFWIDCSQLGYRFQIEGGPYCKQRSSFAKLLSIISGRQHLLQLVFILSFDS